MAKKSPQDPTTGTDSLAKFLRRNLSFRRISLLAGKAGAVLKKQGAGVVLREIRLRLALALHQDYWRFTSLVPLNAELKKQRQAQFAYAPRVSIVVPLYNTPLPFLRQMISSVQGQTYANWQLVLVNASDERHPQVAKAVRRWIKKDRRICCVTLPQNLGIAGNTNKGLEHASGEYIALLDHDDSLQPHALFWVVTAINKDGADLLYSDEIVLDEHMKTARSMMLKFAYGPDTLRGCNFMTHFCVFSRLLMEKAGGGEQSEYDGAQDYDLVLRLSEQAKCIHYIPEALYFWRAHAASTAGSDGLAAKPKAIQAGAAALNAHLARVGLHGLAVPHPQHLGAYRVHYKVQGNPLVSVVIPSYDHADDLARCLESLYNKAGKCRFEVLVIENNSVLPQTEAFYKKAQKQCANLQVLRYKGRFNFSAICNFGVRHAEGEHILLLNNDMEIISDGFLDEMLTYSQRDDVGAVGAMLYYPDDTVQHAGLFVGIGGTAGVNQKGQRRGSAGDMFRLATTQNMSAVTGAALMVKKALYDKLDGLDEENFAVAFNDVDFCLRLIEQGLWNVFTPFANSYHFESKSRGYDTDGPAKERFDKESAAFCARHAAILQAGDPFYNPRLTRKAENYSLAP